MKQHNNQPVDAWKTNNLLSGSVLEEEKEDKKERSGFSYLSFDSSFDDLTIETGRDVETAAVA